MFSWTRKSSSGGRAAESFSSMDSSSRGGGGSSRGRSPRLERRNAAKHIDYDAAGSVSWSSASSAERSPGFRPSRSLDLAAGGGAGPDFRISGSADGEFDELCRSLGLSGPEDFAIPVAAWEARKARSNSDLLPRSSLTPTAADDDDSIARSVSAPEQPSVPAPIPEEPLAASTNSASTTSPVDESPQEDVKAAPVELVQGIVDLALSPRRGGGEGGIRGVRPPVLSPPQLLAPPPSRRTVVPDDRGGSAWDIVQSFAPREEECARVAVEQHANSSDSEEEMERGAGVVEDDLKGLRIGETYEGFTGTSSMSTMNDDDASSTTTEGVLVISPNGKFRRKIKSWMKGRELGRGSFGTVYEGISDEGAFFAVKEVSLLDQGSNAQQSILSLEQEIALLSQFEHENIVQYYGTDKEESKLYIFIELVTQGSLASLYQRYRLQDSQVSAYTRQILNGLVYLHERNVVHRDIKCANILVHVNGSVKLADFGLAKEMSKINMLKSCKGSVYWMAPEVVNPRKTYGPPADMWSLGCTVLEMLTAQIPYPNVEWANALFIIGRGEQPPIPNNLSKEAQDFISQCVRVDPEERPSALQLLEHPFVNRPLGASFDSSSSPATSTCY